MEKKYLIGYLHGQPHVIFDDIQNFKEEAERESCKENCSLRESRSPQG